MVYLSRGYIYLVFLLSHLVLFAQHHTVDNRGHKHSYQDTIPSYYQSPLKIPLALSGTFGELRGNHFHAGLDMKTQGKEGLEVYTAAEGYVSRIKIAHGGYGKALYIQHPNGETTVYGHLKSFAPKIEDYIKTLQYKKQSYTIEDFPKSSILRLNKGELIAYSGNTGGSGGPHLHFEIRNSAQHPLNPMDKGIDIDDNRAPNIRSLWLYKKDTLTNKMVRLKRLPILKDAHGGYYIKEINTTGILGFGVSAYDQQTLSDNKNGLYEIDLSLNDQSIFQMVNDRIPFNHTRYLNRLIDYEYYKSYKSRIIQLFRKSNNPLEIVKLDHKGTFEVKPDLSYQILLKLRDHKDNLRTVRIPVFGTSLDLDQAHLATVNTKEELPIPFDQDYHYDNGIHHVFIPKNALYEDIPLSVLSNNTKLTVGNITIPLHKKMKIVYDVSSYTLEEQSKLYIARVISKDKVSHIGNKLHEGFLLAKTKSFGTFDLVADLIPPKIKALNFKPNESISSKKTLSIKIEDSESGIKSYKATINGKFALMEYDYKTKSLTFRIKDLFTKYIPIKKEGVYTLHLTVTDQVGNASHFETLFRY